MIPKMLLDFARIEKTVLILGAMDHLEIWNPELFESYISARKESYAAVAASVMGVRSI